MKAKVVLITGASSGLGKAMAQKFSEQGHLVIGVSRHCTKESYLDMACQIDITKPEERQQLFDKIMSTYGRLDILINNAGIGCYDAWENVREDELRAMFELDVFALIMMTKLFLEELRKNQGSVINISSVAGKLYVPCMGPYCAGKAAVRFFSDSLRAEQQHRGLHVLDAVVGRINTGFSQRCLGTAKPPHTPGGGDPMQLANAIYRAWQKKKYSVTYPAWYKFIVPLFLGPLRSLYDKECRKRWKL